MARAAASDQVAVVVMVQVKVATLEVARVAKAAAVPAAVAAVKSRLLHRSANSRKLTCAFHKSSLQIRILR